MNATTAQPPPARRLGGSPWVLPEDGITDPVAIEIAASGARRVALTWRERQAAAALILARGGTINRIATRLHIAHSTARHLAATITTPPASDHGAAA